MGNVEAATVRGKGKRQEYDWKTIFISAANMSDKSKWSGSKGAWLHRTHSHTHSHTHTHHTCKHHAKGQFRNQYLWLPQQIYCNWRWGYQIRLVLVEFFSLFSIFVLFPFFFVFAHCCCCFLPSSQNNNMPCLIFVCERISIYCLGVFVHCLVYDTAAFDDLCILNKMSANGRI